MYSFYNTFKNELLEIKSSFYRVSMLTLIPLSVFVIIIVIFHSGVVRDLSVVLVDEDNSKTSRLIAFELDANSVVDITSQTTSMLEAKKLILQNRAYAIIYIPPNFEKDVYLKKVPSLDVFINKQFILIGENLESEIKKSLISMMIYADVVNKMIKVKNIDIAISQENPIQIQQNSFFNSYNNYFLFLVAALIPAIWQIFVMLNTIIAFGSTYEKKAQLSWFNRASKNTFIAILAKMLPTTIVMFLWGVLFLGYFYFYLPWGFEGSFTFMLLTLFVTTLAYQAVALFLFSVTFDYVMTLSASAFYAAPAFAYLGITYPVENMNTFATIWHHLLPISYYIQIQLQQASFGSSILVSLPLLGYISLFLVTSIFTYIRFKRSFR
ncbi:MAG: ABC transporter permease [Campylobacterota bacterium]|nr:ABC transporter permease [Campylobacterota bacterium]